MADKVTRATEFLNLVGWTDDIMVFDFDGDETIQFLDASGGTFDNLAFNNMKALKRLSANAMENAGEFAVDGCPNVEWISVRGFPSSVMGFSNLPALTTINAQDGVGQFDVTIQDCALLAEVNFNGSSAFEEILILNCPSIGSFEATGCALTQQYGVDAILAALASNTIENGSVHLTGGTSASPSAAGLASKATLQGRGWTVTHN